MCLPLDSNGNDLIKDSSMVDKKQPNVLFIICDDLNNAISGMGRAPSAPCPNLQQLMDSGVRFTNAHSNCPLCLPARNMLLSGLYAYTTGQFTLWDPWDKTVHIHSTAEHGRLNRGAPLLGQAVMMPQHFKDNGYNVYGGGKVHHMGKVSDDWWTEYAFRPDYGPQVRSRETGGMMRHPRMEKLYDGEPLASYLERYGGIDRFFLKEGDFSAHIELTFGPMDEIFTPDAGDFVYGDGSPYRYVSDDDRDLLPDENVTNWAVDVLGREHDKPFFLAAGFMKPHSPLNVPRRYFDMFPLDELELPPLLQGDTDDCARTLVENWPFGFLFYGMIRNGGEEMWRKWVQAYLANIAFMDEQVGKIMAALRKSPYADNTIVVFTSDNGYHMGEKEFIHKNTLWEEGGQVPIIFQGPGIAENGQCTRPVSLIDLYPTLIDLCGLPADPHASTHGHPLEGFSMTPLLSEPEKGIWDGPDVALMSVRGNTGIHHSVRSQRYRYTLCGNGEEELYDHETDPNEWTNIAADTAYKEIKGKLRKELVTLVYGQG